jgi:hypothetical protein
MKNIKTTQKNRGGIRQPKWLWRGALAGLVLAVSTGVSYGMTTVFSHFNDASSISGMYFNDWNGSELANGTAFSWTGSEDATGNAPLGALELQCNFGGSANGGVFRISWSGNITAYTALEYDVMIDPASPLDTAGNACDLKVGFNDNVWSEHATDHNISGAGWQHVVVPLSTIGGTGSQPCQEIVFQEYDSNFASPAINKIYVDNVEFTGPDPMYPDYVAFTFDYATCLASNLTAGVTGGTPGTDCTAFGWYGEATVVTWDGTQNSTISNPAITPKVGSGAMHVIANFDNTAINNSDVIALAFNTNYFGSGTWPTADVATNVMIDGTHYSAIEFDVLWDTNLSTMSITNFNSMGDINGIPMGLLATASGNGVNLLNTEPGIPDTASNGWVHMSISIPSSTPTLTQVVGLYFKKYGSGINGALSGTAAYWLDNIVFDGGPLAIPRPTMSISKPVQGLNIVNNSGNGYDRESLIAYQDTYSWVNQSQPVVYSMDIASFPGVKYAGYDARIYLVPDPSGIKPTETTPDWNENSCAVIAVYLNGTGQAVATIGCRNNGGNVNNGNLYDSTNPIFTTTNSPVVGNWSFQFTNNTGIVVTAPDGETTNWTLPLLSSSDLVADFGTTMEVYFGGYNNGTGNNGQRMVLASVGITKGGVPLLYDNFLADTQIDYVNLGGNTWLQASGGSTPESEYLIPANTTTKYYVDWTVPAVGFSLLTNSVLSNTAGWATNTVPDAAAAQYGDHMHTELDVTNLPTSGPLFFLLRHP